VATARWRELIFFMEKIRNFRELRVYQSAIEGAMEIFEITRSFPVEEKYSMVDQIRRSSRSVCANIAEAWRKRIYKAHFVSKLSDSSGEADETRVWLELAFRCRYLSKESFEKLDKKYDLIAAQLVKMMSQPEKWTI
jgi:four helix bundle protein